MRVLVTWGSKRGGTEGIGRIIGEALQARGFEVVAATVEKVHALDSFEAVILGGALYANRWPRRARSFVNRHASQLRKIPVWFFSSGPLDDSAERQEIPPTTEVSVLAERVGAKGHVTFGGRLEPDARGFPAAAMAKNHNGDWRNASRIRAWADQLAAQMPNATPGIATVSPGHSLGRLLGHALAGWALCAATAAVLLSFASLTATLVVHGIAAPLVFGVIAWHYFRARGARQPMAAAVVSTVLVAALDVGLVAGVAERDLAIFTSVAGTWLPLALIFLVIWATGELMSTMPWSASSKKGG